MDILKNFEAKTDNKKTLLEEAQELKKTKQIHQGLFMKNH